MAHADYECCACCDRRIAYSPGVPAKDELCGRCAAELAVRGVLVHDAVEFLAWVNREDPARLAAVLSELEFSQCCYWNEIDEAVKAKLGRDFGR